MPASYEMQPHSGQDAVDGGNESGFVLQPIGWVESPLGDRKDAPRQADENAPAARIVLRDEVTPGLLQLAPGTPVHILTWLHLAQRDVLQVYPRHDLDRPLCGVFATRSPDRPNPIGLHTTEVVTVEGNAIEVAHLEAVDGTPVIDIKPVLGPIGCR
jgi:tRNA-Thr(GGU) m(6)t(6)A37 methyltransferase TsaA